MSRRKNNDAHKFVITRADTPTMNFNLSSFKGQGERKLEKKSPIFTGRDLEQHKFIFGTSKGIVFNH